MKEWIMTCNNTEDLWREDVRVSAETFDEAWDKAKQKARRKHGGRIANIHITATKEVRP